MRRRSRCSSEHHRGRAHRRGRLGALRRIADPRPGARPAAPGMPAMPPRRWISRRGSRPGPLGPSWSLERWGRIHGHRRNPPVQPSVSRTTSGRLGLARRLAGDSMALTPRGRLRWSRGGRGWGGRLRSWLAPQQPLEVSRRASQTARPGGTLALPAWPNRVPTGLPNPARDRPVAPPGEFKMPACAPLHHPFRGPEYARRPPWVPAVAHRRAREQSGLVTTAASLPVGSAGPSPRRCSGRRSRRLPASGQRRGRTPKGFSAPC